MYYIFRHSCRRCYLTAPMHCPDASFAISELLLSPPVDCCLIMFPSWLFTKAPANTESSVAFRHIAITDNWLLVFTSLLLRTLAVAVISLRCVAALPLIIFFSPITELAIETDRCFYNGHCHQMVAAFVASLIKYILNLQSPFAWWRHRHGCCCFYNRHCCRLIDGYSLIVVAVAVAITAPCTIARTTTVTLANVAASWLLLL